MNENHKGPRLPPPAFPPGVRRRAASAAAAPIREGADLSERGAPEATGLEGAFISPDDPMPVRSHELGAALISPDDPLPERLAGGPTRATGREAGQPVGHASADEEEAPLPDWEVALAEGEGVVTGMGDDPHLHPDELVSGGDPHVLELMESVGKLAEALRRRGEAGLRATPEMSRFEATLRAYCVGYLAGRRAEVPPPPAFDPFPDDFF